MTPNRPGTPTTTFRIDPDLLARVKAQAAREGTTMTDVVRRALTEYADGAEQEPTEEQK